MKRQVAKVFPFFFSPFLLVLRHSKDVVWSCKEQKGGVSFKKRGVPVTTSVHLQDVLHARPTTANYFLPPSSYVPRNSVWTATHAALVPIMQSGWPLPSNRAPFPPGPTTRANRLVPKTRPRSRHQTQLVGTRLSYDDATLFRGNQGPPSPLLKISLSGRFIINKKRLVIQK